MTEKQENIIPENLKNVTEVNDENLKRYVLQEIIREALQKKSTNNKIRALVALFDRQYPLAQIIQVDEAVDKARKGLFFAKFGKEEDGQEQDRNEAVGA